MFLNCEKRYIPCIITGDSSDKQLIVINPEIDDLTRKVCGLLGKAENILNNVEKAGFQGRACNGLLFFKARAEELTIEKTKDILGLKNT